MNRTEWCLLASMTPSLELRASMLTLSTTKRSITVHTVVSSEDNWVRT